MHDVGVDLLSSLAPLTLTPNPNPDPNQVWTFVLSSISSRDDNTEPDKA